MTKQPEVTERWRIICETSHEGFGPVMGMLTRMGAELLEPPKLIENVHLYKQKKQHDTSTEQELTKWIKEHPTFEIKEFVAHCKAIGRTPGAAYTASKIMVEKGLLKKLSPGNYSIPGVKQIAGPKTKQTKPANTKTKRGKVPVYDVPNKDIVAKAMRGRKNITMRELTKLFQAKGRNPKSISPIITKMIAAKQIKTLESGVYQVLARKKPTVDPAVNKIVQAAEEKREKDRLRARAVRDRKKAERLAAMNGAGPTTTTATGETANG